MERPVANDSQPLTVVFTLSLIQIMDVVSGHLPGATSRDAWSPDEVGLVLEPRGKKLASRAVIKMNFFFFFSGLIGGMLEMPHLNDFTLSYGFALY